MNEAIAVCRSAEDLHKALRLRADHLQLARDEIDDIAGLPRGYAGKLLCDPPLKGLGPISAFPMIGALGMVVVLIEDADMMRRVLRRPRRIERNVRKGKHHWRNAKPLSMLQKLLRKYGAIGGKRRMETLSATRRSEIATDAANARWRNKK